MPLTLNPSVITLLQAKTSVCRPAGTQNDADALVAAGEALRNTLFTLNNKKDWNWLQNTTSVVTSNATVTLPSRLKKIYSVSTTTRPLRYLPQRDWDRQNPEGQALGGLFYYTAFNMAETGVILLRDAPTVSTTITVNYLKLLTVPAADGTTFSDLPEQAMDYVLNEATTRYLTEKGAGDDQIARYERKAAEALAALTSDYVREIDHDAVFMPAEPTERNIARRNFADQWYD